MLTGVMLGGAEGEGLDFGRRLDGGRESGSGASGGGVALQDGE